jgi:hypothetical protein
LAIRKRDEQRERGLPSLNEARQERRRAIVFGRARLPALPPYFWLWLGIGLAAFGVVYWRIVQGQLESDKSAVMAKQRAIAATLGNKLAPFLDRMETWARELAGPYPGDHAAPGIPFDRFSRTPSVYLRLRLANAGTAQSIRKAAQASLRDGFTSCLFVAPGNPTTAPGRACRATSECEPGSLCNEYHRCARPAQPYNARLAYRAMRVLSNEWTDELHQATSDLAVSAYDRDLVAVTRTDVPIAIELLSRARYFTLVLDEEPTGALPAADPDAGETLEERLQRTAHPARVGIWDLQTSALVLRLRTAASGQLMSVGDRTVTLPQTVFAQQRQANSCALALQVKRALLLHDPGAADRAPATNGNEPPAADRADAGFSDAR